MWRQYMLQIALYIQRIIYINCRNFLGYQGVPMTIKKAKEVVRKKVGSEHWQISETRGYR